MPPLLPPGEEHAPTLTPPIIKAPTAKQQSWGAVISMLIIVLMIVVGAFYAWGKKINEQRAALEQLTGTSTTP